MPRTPEQYEEIRTFLEKLSIVPDIIEVSHFFRPQRQTIIEQRPLPGTILVFEAHKPPHVQLKIQ